MKYLLLFSTLWLAVYCTGCKKTGSTPGTGTGGDGGTTQPLIPAASGWQKVGTVNYTYTNTGFSNQNAMQPVELIKAGGKLAILYSEDFRLSGVVGRQFYKGVLDAGGTATLYKISLGSGTDDRTGLYKQHFIPGTPTAVALKYYQNGNGNTYLAVKDESGVELTNHFVGHPGRNAKVYSNGDVIDGTIDYSAYAELDFYNKTTNSWVYIKGTSHDTTELYNYTPFRLLDGSLRAFNITGKNSKLYLSIARPSGATYPSPLYKSYFLQHIPSLEGDLSSTQTPAILCSTQDGNAFTVVLGTYLPNSNTIGKVSAYKWASGDNHFTVMYSSIDVPPVLSDYFKAGAAQCTAEGDLYVWVNSPDGATGSLNIVNGSGVQTKGGLTYNGSPVRLGAITNIDGSYYGVAYPVTDQYDTKHNLRMEIVKLK